MTYEKAFDFIVGIEGGPTNHAWDPSGETAYGIARNRWPQYWQDGQPTRAVAKAFYRAEFWNPLRLDQIENGPLRMELFEAAVNCGKGRAVTFAQEAYNLLRPKTAWNALTVDGVIGPLTVCALNRMTRQYAAALLAGCNYYQAAYYVSLNESLREQALRGWFAKRLRWPLH